MEDFGVVKLYEPSPIPGLYVAPAENMVESVLLILFLMGNFTNFLNMRKRSDFLGTTFFITGGLTNARKRRFNSTL